jgi:hypothetical protein
VDAESYYLRTIKTYVSFLVCTTGVVAVYAVTDRLLSVGYSIGYGLGAGKLHGHLGRTSTVCIGKYNLRFVVVL